MEEAKFTWFPKLTVTVALPPGFTFDSSTAPAGTSYDATTGTWTVPSLPAGGSLTRPWWPRPEPKAAPSAPR